MISALGRIVRIDVSALEQDDRDALHRVWSGASVSGPADDIVDGGVVEAPSGMRTAPMLASISQRVTRAAIGARRGEMWMLHAGAVADEAGRVVVVVGPSGRGKTTAMRALARHYAYVTDETVAIDGAGIVHPYRKPLSIIEEIGAAKAQRAPGELGLGELPDAPLRVAALVLLDRRTNGPDAAVLEPCDLGDALVDLAEQSSHLAELPHALQTIAEHAMAVGGVHRVTYREADTLVDALSALFRDPSAIAITPRTVEVSLHSPDVDEGEGAGWFRTPHLDALALRDPERIALLLPGDHGGALLRVLDGIGPVLWTNADGRSTDEMVRIVIGAHGEPDADDATAIVAASLSELVDQGLLRHREEAGPDGVGTQFQQVIR